MLRSLKLVEVTAIPLATQSTAGIIGNVVDPSGAAFGERRSHGDERGDGCLP